MHRKLLFSGMVLSVLLCSSLVVSVDAASVWSQTYGGTGQDTVCSLVATSDGGYALAGNTESFGAGGRDVWLVKTDPAGYMEWNRTYGGASADWANSMVATPDGGYAIAGATRSFSVEGYDFWLIKTDALGNMEWNKTYGGASEAKSLIATSDGGYAIAGRTSFPNPDLVWFVKTDAHGNMEWNKLYNVLGINRPNVVIATPDGGYALAGNNWLIKTDTFGNLQWNKTYGEAWTTDNGTVEYYRTNTVIATPDGGYTLAGVRGNQSGTIMFSTGNTGARSLAEASGEVYLTANETPSNYQSLLLVKTDALGNIQWNRTYEGGTNAGGTEKCSLIATSDGGYALAGQTYSAVTGVNNGKFFLVKTDEFGSLQWNRTYGEKATTSQAYSLIQTSDGGYALAGEIYAYSDNPMHTGFDFWLVKTDESGFSIVPEYSSLLVPALVLTATAFVIISKKRFSRKSA